MRRAHADNDTTEESPATGGAPPPPQPSAQWQTETSERRAAARAESERVVSLWPAPAGVGDNNAFSATYTGRSRATDDRLARVMSVQNVTARRPG